MTMFKLARGICLVTAVASFAATAALAADPKSDAAITTARP
jgi:hypothetical protein